MRDYSLTHLSDVVLLRDLTTLIVQERATTAAMLAHLAEVDARRLYVPAGYASMHAYCVGELRVSEDAALKRIQAARASRQFPVLFDALAEGRLHLTGVCLLAPHLNLENVHELLAATTHRRKSEIEELLARRFPRSEQEAVDRTVVRVLPSVAVPFPQHAPAHVDCLTLDTRWTLNARERRSARRVVRPRFLPPSVFSSGSPLGSGPTTSSATPRPCSATPFLRETSLKCSTGRSTL